MPNSEQPTAIAATAPRVRFAWLLPPAAILLPVGLCLCTLASTWKRPEGSSFITSLISSTEGQLGVVLTVVAILGIWSGVRAWPSIEDSSDVVASERRYNRYLLGIGYALFVCGVFCCALVAGLIFSKRMPVSAAEFEDSIFGHPRGLGLLIALSSVVAVLGALFFVANSLRHKREARVEPFSARRFWGGLWYRLGEAILFSLVIFWLIWYYTPTSNAATQTNAASATPATANVGTATKPATTNAVAPREPLLGYKMLPVLSLLMGMFVTSGEKLIFGIARGLFRAAGAFFGSSDNREPERGVQNVSDER